jgi:cobalt-zinc-cadmium efflux system outer membrane protein
VRDAIKTSTVSAFGAVLLLVTAAGAAEAPAAPPTFLRLEDLESLALRGNPTMAQAEAVIRAAEGRRVQAGLYPNPTVGYSGQELAFRGADRKSEHFLFAQQTFVTAGKLRYSREVAAQDKVQAQILRDAQRQRLLTAVRLLFYEALGAARFVELRQELARIVREAVGVSEELYNVGQADRPDVLEAEVEAQRADLDLVEAQNNQERVWQQLAAVVGDPELPPSPLAGDLEAEVPALDEREVVARLLRESPDVQIAQAGVERARAALRHARAERIPNVVVRGGLGYSTEPTDRNRDTGVEAFVEIGVPLPIFNRNQGNIAAAEAELDRTERDLRRVELALRSRVSPALAAYRSRLHAVDRYQRQILPRAEQAYALYLARFRQMAAAYPQVLISQRTLAQARTDYVRALMDVWQQTVLVRGLLLTGGLEEVQPPGGPAETGAMPSPRE